MELRLRALPVPALVLSLALSSSAWAKSVQLRWSPLPGAVAYELEIRRPNGDRAPALPLQTLQRPTWKGHLPVGPFSYRVRGIDRAKRHGRWSEEFPLVVTPANTRLINPEKQRLEYYGTRQPEVTLRWKPVVGASSYRLEILEGRRVVLNEILKDPEFKLPRMQPGIYRYRVATVLELPESPLFLNLGMRAWQNPQAESGELVFDKKPLLQPEQRYPLGNQELPEEGLVAITWKPTDGATRYEVIVEEIKAQTTSRSLASDQSDPAPVHRQTVDAEVSRIVMPPPKLATRYRWRVRAFAGEEAGPESTAEFALEAPLKLKAKQGAIRLIPAAYRFDYEASSSGGRPGAQFSSEGISAELEGEYWMTPRWGMIAQWEHMLLSLPADITQQVAYGVLAGTRASLHRWLKGWTASVHGGLGSRPTFRLDYQTQLAEGVQAVGPTFRLETQLDLTSALSARAGTQILLPSSVSDGNGLRLATTFWMRLAWAWRSQLLLTAEVRTDSLGVRSRGSNIELSGTRLGLGLSYRIEPTQ